MVRVNVSCVVDAKKEYTRHFTAKILPAIQDILRDLASDATLLARHEGRPLEGVVRDMLHEVPDWPPSVWQEMVGKFRAACPGYMGIFRKIYLANCIIVNTVHSRSESTRPTVDVPEEEEVVRTLLGAVALELQHTPRMLLDDPRLLARTVVDILRDAVLRTVPLDEIAASDDEEESGEEEPGAPESAAEPDGTAAEPDGTAETPPAEAAEPEREASEGGAEVRRVVLDNSDW